jgi:hypothetical protein
MMLFSFEQSKGILLMLFPFVGVCLLFDTFAPGGKFAPASLGVFLGKTFAPGGKLIHVFVCGSCGSSLLNSTTTSKDRNCYGIEALTRV